MTRIVPFPLALPTIGVGIVLLATFLYYAISSLFTATPITYPEGAHVAAILRLRAGEPLYPPFLAFPPLITPYPPLLYLADAMVTWPFNLDALSTTVVSRAVTLIASLGAAVLVALLARNEGAGTLAAVSIAALLLPIPLFDHWAFAVRPDLPALGLSLAAGWLALRGDGRLRSAGGLAALAMLTKLTAVSMPIAITLWLLSQRRGRAAAQFVLAVGAAFAVGAGLTLALSGGQALGHTVIAHMNPLLTVEHAVRVFLELPKQAWLPFMLAILGLAIQARDRRLQLSGWYWLVTLGVGLYSLRGRGGDVNYLLEPAAATCWLSGHGLTAVWNETRRGHRLGLVSAFLVAAASIIWGFQTFAVWRKDGGVDMDRQQPIAEIAEIPEASPVLTEEPTMVLLAGKPLIASDVFHLSMLQTAGRYDPVDLIQRIRQREFGLVVLRGDVRQTRYINGQPKWPESVRRAIAEYYQLSKRVDLYWLYVPDRPGR